MKDIFNKIPTYKPKQKPVENDSCPKCSQSILGPLRKELKHSPGNGSK